MFAIRHCRPSGLPAPSVQRHPAGFTLVECLVVMALLVVLLAVAVPGLQHWVAAQALASNVQAFESALRLARAEAQRRGGAVTVCILDIAQPDEPACARRASGGWQAGWMVFADGAARGDRDAQDRVIAIEHALTASGPVVSSRRTVTFEPTGLALNGTGSYIFYPPGGASSGELPRTVCVNKQGRARAADAGRGCA